MTHVMRQLPAFMRTSHALLTRCDGFITQPQAWNDEFLVHDYVGAVWPDEPEESAVGDGGFSLRPKRFLAAGMDVRITLTHPEDEVLCGQRHFMEQAHGVIFGPPAAAQRFAVGEPGVSGALGLAGDAELPLLSAATRLLRALSLAARS